MGVVSSVVPLLGTGPGLVVESDAAAVMVAICISAPTVMTADTTTGNEPSGVVPGNVRITAVSVPATVGVQVN